jgi:hypothetical protein
MRVLGGVDFRGSFEFEFDFKLFFSLSLVLPFFVSFVGFVIFSFSRGPS